MLQEQNTWTPVMRHAPEHVSCISTNHRQCWPMGSDKGAIASKQWQRWLWASCNLCQQMLHRCAPIYRALPIMARWKPAVHQNMAVKIRFKRLHIPVCQSPHPFTLWWKLSCHCWQRKKGISCVPPGEENQEFYSHIKKKAKKKQNRYNIKWPIHMLTIRKYWSTCVLACGLLPFNWEMCISISIWKTQKILVLLQREYQL